MKILNKLRIAHGAKDQPMWLTEFEDERAYGKASGDLYFAPANSSKVISRPRQMAATSVDLSFVAVMIAAIWRPVRRRRPQQG